MALTMEHRREVRKMGNEKPKSNSDGKPKPQTTSPPPPATVDPKLNVELRKVQEGFDETQTKKKK
jgi:hypothetical protein